MGRTRYFFAETLHPGGPVEVIIDDNGILPEAGPMLETHAQAAMTTAATSPAGHYAGSELLQVTPYGGKSPVGDDDPDEQLPAKWGPGDLIAQVERLREFQFGHVLFTDRILIDGVTPVGFQPMENSPYTRRFTSKGEVLRLEDGQPTAVGRRVVPVPAAPLPDQPMQTHSLVFDWSKTFIQDHKEATGRGNDVVEVEFTVPSDYVGNPAHLGFISLVEYPAGPVARSLSFGVKGGAVLIPDDGVGGISLRVNFTVNNPSPGAVGADVNLEPGVTYLARFRGQGSASEPGNVRAELASPARY